MTRQFGFKEQLEVGQNGENIFVERYPYKLTVHPGRDGDFIDSKGRKIELKTDTYCMSKTPNFFIERYSDVHKKSPGSLWQAHEHGCDIFVYMFIKNNTYFIIKDIPAALQILDDYYESNPSLVYVKNRGWVTGGLKVPRELLKDVYSEYHWGDDEG